MKHIAFVAGIGLFFLLAGCTGKKSDTDSAKGKIRVVEVERVAKVKTGMVRDGRPVFLIPASALFMRGQLEGVQVVGDEDIVSVRWIRTGNVSGDEVEVLSGLAEDEKVVAPYVGGHQEGFQVTVKQ